jgi:ATP-binding protein involved in chromosome partitioning
MSDEFIPERIDRLDDGLLMQWAGSEPRLLPARVLRLGCQCAGCKDEMTGLPILDPASVPADITPMSVHLVGSYAIRIDWSDGHGSGIYPYEWLHDMAERHGAPR